MWRLFSHYLFLVSLCFDALERLCFVTVALSGYLHLYFQSGYASRLSIVDFR